MNKIKKVTNKMFKSKQTQNEMHECTKSKNFDINSNSNSNSYYMSENSINEDVYQSNKFDFDSEENEENQKLTKLRNFYIQENKNQKCEESITNNHHINSQNNQIVCKICFNNSNSKTESQENQDNFIILSCNHTFHIKCLAEIQFNDMFKFHVIDSEYFKTRKCMVCNKCLGVEELLFLHSKFLANTKKSIDDHEISIKNLELKLKNLKDELRSNYEYRNKLQHEREKSKEMVANLTMMI